MTALAATPPTPPTAAPPRRPGLDAGQLRRFLSLVVDPAAGCAELCVLGATINRAGLIVPGGQFGRTLAGWYDDADALAAAAANLRGVSAYVTANPVRRDLLARSCNALARVRHRTRDEDIAALRWLFLDIDPVRPPDISSTDAELAAAVDRRDAILSDLPGVRDKAAWGRSGNGAWILVRLPDYPNDDRHRGIVSRFVDRVALEYSDGRVEVDVKTKNPARVMCLPGTLKCKGSSIAGRPWRLATIDGGLA